MKNKKAFIFDIEGDGLWPSKIYCLSCVDIHSGECKTYTSYDEIIKFLLNAEVLIGHNVVRWDITQLERLLGIKVTCTIIDTLAVSWYLEPERKRHGLESYGIQYGDHKVEILDWNNLSLEAYIERCEKDVVINRRLFNEQWNYLLKIYGSEQEALRFIKYLTFKLKCAQLQEKSGWLLDLEYCNSSLQKLMLEQQDKLQKLAAIMPKVPVKVTKTVPKKPLKKDGTFSRIGQDWFDLLARNNLPENTPEVNVIVSYEDGNPKSSVQVKDWLFSLGWKPQTFKYKKDSEGNEKKIPQINKEHGAGICDSIKILYDQEPELHLLDGLSILSHRIGILAGFIRDVNSQGYLQAQVSGLTNTLRFQHTTIVNLPKVDRPYGKEIRGSLIAPEGYELCGADMASLEDRLKQHYIYPIDPDYVRTMLRDDFDPHLELAMMAGKTTVEDKYFYQQYDPKKASEDEQKKYKKIKGFRNIFKNGNYACQYGAYPPKLALTCNISLAEAKEVFDAYWKLNWAIQVVSKSLTVKEVNGEKWLYNPVSRFWYNLRKENDRFSTLVQGTASYVFDLWVEKILESREQLTAQFHDEIVLTVKENFRDKIVDYLNKCIDKTNQILKLNRELGIGINFGKSYADIH